VIGLLAQLWPWLALAALGAYHGINPAMGWLFAVALGLQERSRRAVLEALLPIALGHEASIALAVAVVSAVELVAAPSLLRIGGAVVLVLFGLFKLLRPGAHPRWVGMRVSRTDLVAWSFLMSTAHGAGLMLFPILLGLGQIGSTAEDLPTIRPSIATLVTDLGAVLVHTLAMLVVMAIVAVVVYEKIGLAVLRRAWINLDLLWAVTVVWAGVVTLFT